MEFVSNNRTQELRLNDSKKWFEAVEANLIVCGGCTCPSSNCFLDHYRSTPHHGQTGALSAAVQLVQRCRESVSLKPKSEKQSYLRQAIMYNNPCVFLKRRFENKPSLYLGYGLLGQVPVPVCKELFNRVYDVTDHFLRTVRESIVLVSYVFSGFINIAPCHLVFPSLFFDSVHLLDGIILRQNKGRNSKCTQ